MAHMQMQSNNSNSNNKWKITSILSNGGPGTDLANAPARPPWRPAAATVQIGSNALALPAQLPPTIWRKQRSNQLTIPPQYVSATDLVAALPKRQRMPRPQAASTQFISATKEVAVVTPASSRSGSGSGERSSPRSEKAVRSAEGTPNSVLDAPNSNPQSAHSSAMRSRAGSPPSCPRSAQLSPSQSTRARSTGHDRSSDLSHQSRQSSQHSASTPRLNTTDTTQADKEYLPSRGSSGSHSSRVTTSSSMQSQRHAPSTPGHSSLGPGSPKSLATEVSMRHCSNQGGEDRRASPPSRRASPPSPSTIYKTPLFNTPPASHQQSMESP